MRFKHSPPLGFSLVEVAMALGIAAFCLVSVFALFPTGLAVNHAATQQTADTTLARAIAADLSVTPITVQNSPRYNISIPATGTATHTIFVKDDGTLAGAPDLDADPLQDPRYRATIIFTAPSSATQKTATGVRILLTWPALADRNASVAPSKYAGAYEIITAINRN